MEKSQHTDFNENTTNESASVACSNVRLWKLDSPEEWRNVSWHFWDERTENDSAGFVDSKKNEWVLNKAGVKREVLDTVKARKLVAYYGHTIRKQESCLEKDIISNNTKFLWNRTIGRWVMAKKVIFKMAAAAILNCKKISFGHVNRIRFNSCYSVPNFIKIWPFFIEIWRFNDFRNGGRSPSWILKICRFCYLALVDMPFCFLIQNFAEIKQSVDELWPKKRFSRCRPPPSWISKIFWSSDCNWVQYVM